MVIRLLTPEVASQIAAGEVIERPASVVKELLENSLDAGASHITISVEGGGQRLVEVADNGCGIPAEELPLAVERHATSKLARAEDLFNISTLGFRGEALASIGSVSRLTITSRTAAGPTGVRLVVEGGSTKAPQPQGAPVGTVVRVEDLFYNLPARRKFLKQEGTERRAIDELVTKYALAYPNVRFHLQQEARSALQTTGNGQPREILTVLYGVEIGRQMLEVVTLEEGLDVNGFISPPAVTRSNRREITFFVNGRPIHDAALVTALLKAYHTLLMVGRYPLAVMFLKLPTEAVDVNVHPTKAEVRFKNPDLVFTGVQRAIRRAILANTPVPGLEMGVRWQTGQDGPSPTGKPGFDWQAVGSKYLEPEGFVAALQPGDSAAPSSTDTPAAGPDFFTPGPKLDPERHSPILRLVGQIANTYLAAEGPDGLYLIDQHAAHERVLFEHFQHERSQAGKAGLPGQTLLQPVTVDLPPSNARLLAEQMPFLADLGFEVEPFGTHTFLIRAVPALLADSEPEAALRVLVEDFEEDETPLQAETEARLVARICKRAAVKAGKRLSNEEQAALLMDLENCRQPRTCPHGRPTMIHLSVDLLERQFGRRGAR